MFVALDLFLFYVFWEVMLIPMYLLIGIWGNPARRIYAAVKFFIFTMLGSLLMLVAILVLYFYHGSHTGAYTFDLLSLYMLTIPVQMQIWLFLAFGLAFAIKVPMFPFHTWLPDAHTEAPTVGSVLLAAVLLKMGTYGFLRFNLPLFPEASVLFLPLLPGLALVGIIYGALVAMVQADVKRLVAFSSVSHLGFVVLGIFALNVGRRPRRSCRPTTIARTTSPVRWPSPSPTTGTGARHSVRCSATWARSPPSGSRAVCPTRGSAIRARVLSRGSSHSSSPISSPSTRPRCRGSRTWTCASPRDSGSGGST